MNKKFQDKLKYEVACKATEFIKQYSYDDSIIGVGTGSTVNFLIEELASIKGCFKATVSSSDASTKLLEEKGIKVLDLNEVNEVTIYIDGADESNHHLQLIKGGGGALTREKIIAAAAQKFICIADESKFVDVLGEFPLPIEVIPMARSYIARKIISLGGVPVYREGFVTENGNHILDIRNLKIKNPTDLEEKINQITGVVSNGLFANRPADLLFLGTNNGVITKKRN